jgi:ATP-dependent 26S proteasome regulatory subunit
MAASLTHNPSVHQRALQLALDDIAAQLQRFADSLAHPDAASPDEAPLAMQGSASALDTLCALFDLKPFARQVLVLCAGMELRPDFAKLCADAHANPSMTYPTFGLALAALRDAEWSTLMPTAPLRRWQLIRVDPGATLMSCPLRIDERILHYLVDCSYVDERVAALIAPVHPPESLAPSHRAVVDAMLEVWEREPRDRQLPVIQLLGEEHASLRDCAAAACARLGLQLHSLAVDALPTNSVELDALIRLWEREAALSRHALLIGGEDYDAADHARMAQAARVIERAAGVLVLCSRERRQTILRPTIPIEVLRPNTEEQRYVWRSTLGTRAQHLNGQIDQLAAQFGLGASAIRQVSETTLATHAEHTSDKLGAALWDACRVYARPRLDDLAQRIAPSATWDDLVLPATQLRILHEIEIHVRQRAKVFETWGFAEKGARGQGLSALFAGASGTGKTMAAEVLARALKLDLYRIDLSAVVSKYIGETEKNLRRIFDAAEAGGAILLFDEADALFGKRSEVKDSHDRYANIEVSYLLQRMESYRGLAILTTNQKGALDSAFLRRIRFIVQFPFPDAAQRAEIWRRIFPASTPCAPLLIERLAQLNVAGGNIRNIALNAAFLAAHEDAPVNMVHLLRAARSEYTKLEKSLTDTEIAGWHDEPRAMPVGSPT